MFPFVRFVNTDTVKIFLQSLLPEIITFRMFDLNFGVRTEDLDPVITALHMSRQV